MDKYERMLELLRNSMLATKHTHICVFDDNVSDSVSLAHMNYATGKVAVAEAFYYSNIDELERTDIEEYFHQFDVFAKELLNDCRTNHSKQWVDIEYQRLKQIYNESGFGPSFE